MAEAADVVRRKIAAFNAQDRNETLAVFSPDCEKEVPGATLHGADQVVSYFGVFWEAFPDLHLTITREVEQGPIVAIQAVSTGTHLGTLRTPNGDVPATGQRLSLTLSDFYEISGGRIVSSRLHFDQLTLLEQLGLAPAPSPA